MATKATNKQVKKKHQSPRRSGPVGEGLPDLWVFAPIAIVLGLVPLIVRLYVEKLSGPIAATWIQNQDTDFFSHYKVTLLTITAIVMVLIIAYSQGSGRPLSYTDHRLTLIALGVIAVMSILATIFSAYKGVALWGAPERSEGLITYLIYLLLVCYGLFAFRQEKQIIYIMAPLAFCTSIVLLIGISQYMGKDVLFSDFGKKLLVPGQYAASRETMKGLFGAKQIYGTMFNTNYVGSYGAMMVPLYLTMTFFAPKAWQKATMAAMTAASLFLLLGSNSHAGLVGLFVALLFFVVLLGRYLLAHWKASLAAIVLLAIGLVGVNMATNGLVKAQLPLLQQEVVAFFAPAEAETPGRERIFVRDIIQADKAITLAMADGASVTISYEQGGLVFRDQNGGLVPTVPYSHADLNGERIRFTTAPYNAVLDIYERQVQGEDGEVYHAVSVMEGNTQRIIITVDEETGSMGLLNSRGYPMTYQEAPALGFAGKEHLGSNRGFIWSRSLPVALDALILGKGPDTFILAYPQNDILAKWAFAYNPWLVVDKPHNLYLQIMINQGGIALAAFLFLACAYMVKSIRLYGLRSRYSLGEGFGLAIFLGVMGYLGAGFFNDSIVSVAPIFWLLLGIGIGANHYNQQNQATAVALDD